jgi:hypothetical protein
MQQHAEARDYIAVDNMLHDSEFNDRIIYTS